jgi:O-antigen/teichoic acid export membrane protein
MHLTVKEAALPVPLLSKLTLASRSDFVRKSIHTYATQIVGVVLSLTASVLVTRTLGPTGRGIYAVALAVGGIGVQLGNCGLHLSHTYYVARDHALLPTLLGNSLGASFGLSGLLAAAIGVIFHYVPRLAPVHGTPLLIGLLWVPFSLAFMLSENLLLGVHEIRSFNLLELANRLIAVVLIGLLIASGVHRVEWFLGASLATVILSLLFAIHRLNRLLHDWPRPSMSLFLKTLKLGFKAYIVVLLSFLVLRIDLLMVKYLLGAEQAGYYSVAASMADVCLMLPMVIGTILFPKLSSEPNLRLRRQFALKAATGVAVVLLPLLTVACVSAVPAVRLVFGSAFLPSAAAFVWLSPGIFALGIEMVIVQFLNSLGFPISVVMTWVLSTLFNIGANLWAIRHFGIVGASAVSSLSYALTCMLVVVLLFRARGIEDAPLLQPAI